jgi:predicted small secreted protein
MKKLIIVLAALCMTVAAHAQFGVMAGVTSTETDIKDAAAKIGDVTQYHVGVAFTIGSFPDNSANLILYAFH